MFSWAVKIKIISKILIRKLYVEGELICIIYIYSVIINKFPNKYNLLVHSVAFDKQLLRKQNKPNSHILHLVNRPCRHLITHFCFFEIIILVYTNLPSGSVLITNVLCINHVASFQYVHYLLPHSSVHKADLIVVYSSTLL